MEDRASYAVVVVAASAAVMIAIVARGSMVMRWCLRRRMMVV